MKGLLIKDFYLLKNMKQGFLMIVVMCIAFGFIYKTPDFLIIYMTLMASIFMLSTIGYDKQDNGMSYLFSLPVSRKGYVKEKYVFGILVILLSLVIMTVFSCVIFRIRNIGYGPVEIGRSMLSSFITALLIQSISIPIEIKFDAEKSRAAMMIATGCAFLLAFLLVKLIKMGAFDLSALIDRITAAGPAAMIGIGVTAAVVILAISFAISLHIIKKKEF